MRKNIISGVIALVGVVLLSGCGASSPRVAKVYETNYPEGISVSIYDGKIKEDVAISDARMSYGSNKSQVQFIINNRSEDIYNLVVNSEWTDKRGTVIPTYPRPQKIRLEPSSGKRMVVQAPNFKAKNVLINVECGNNCIVEKE